MEDRYLFKAKRVDNGGWAVGYIARYGHTGKENCYIIPSYASDLYSFLIDENTICQCTGLKDKNGNLIWENDVVKGAWFDKGKSHRHIGTVSYICCAYKVVGVKQYYGLHDELNGSYTVISNIFDNPELLESEG